GRYVPYSELSNPVLRSAGYLAEHFAETPLLFFGFAKADAGSSIYPALWSAQLAARAEGASSTLPPFPTRELDTVFSILGVPRGSGWQIYGCVPMGYPTGRWGIATRRPGHEVAGRNTWNGPLGFEVPEPLWQPAQRSE